MALSHPLIDLAYDKSHQARTALVSQTAVQFLDESDAANLMERTLFADILVRLYKHARQDVRQKLSAALAMADWAPASLVRELALDTIDIAEPIIAFCPVVNDDILIEVVRACGLEHRLCVAERPHIGEKVCGALIAVDDERVLSVLAENATARIDPDDFGLAMDMLRGSAEGLDTLVQRYDLPTKMVATAYALAGSQARQVIANRLPPRLERRLTSLTEMVTNDAADAAVDGSIGADLSEAVRKSVRSPSGKPTPGSLLAALMRGERAAFIRGLSQVLNLPTEGVGRKITSQDPEILALAARAAHFDVSVVRTFYEQLAPKARGWTSADDRVVSLIWMRTTPDTARSSFASGVQG
jgi:uncharacterized protein (DUF2336 family)